MDLEQDASHPGMVRLSGTLICASQEECEIVRAHLPEHVSLTRAEPGCLFFAVIPIDAMTWRVEERFTDSLAFAAHQARTKASAWGTKTAAIRRDYAIIAADRSSGPAGRD